MIDATVERLVVGTGTAERQLAVLRRAGGSPGIFCMTGYTGNMGGFDALDAFAAGEGAALVRFDYRGHGQSGGQFLDCGISDWLDDASAVFARTTGPQIIVGVSMGGWLALHLAERNTERIAGLVLLAPAIDMTDMIHRNMSAEGKDQLRGTGFFPDPKSVSDERSVVTRQLIDDGARYSLAGRRVAVNCPVRILHGTGDESVPHRLSLDLFARIASDDAQYTLIADGDHALSRPADERWLFSAVRELRARS